MAEITRLERLLRLLEALGRGRPTNASVLAEMCQVSRRTIFRDLATLQASGIHVHYNEERQGYFLTRPLFLRPADLTLEETLALIVMGEELGDGASGLMFCDHVRTAAVKLACNLPEKIREAVNDITDSVSIRIGNSGTTEADRTNFDLVKQALAEHRCVRIRYNSLFDKKEIETRLSPYRILFSRREWYVIGRSSLQRAVRTFKVTRIQQAELLDDRYKVPPRFNLDRYFGNAWHLIRRPEEPAHVVIRFQPLVAQNVAEVTWHKTQQIAWNEDGTIDFHVDLEGVDEVAWWILGYGDQAEVLEPAALRERLRQRIDQMQKLYAESPRERPADLVGKRKRKK